MWENGDVNILFPTNIDWSLAEWLRYSTSAHSRRVAANRMLNPDTAWKPMGKTGAIYTLTQRAVREYNSRMAKTQLQTENRLREKFGRWLHGATTFLPRFLVCALLLVAAWSKRTGATATWWSTNGIPTSRLMYHWGPFHVDVPKKASAVDRWIGDQLALMVTIIASVWFRYGCILQDNILLSVEHMDGEKAEKTILSLESEMRDHLTKTLIPMWTEQSIKQSLFPPDIKNNVFTDTRVFSGSKCPDRNAHRPI